MRIRLTVIIIQAVLGIALFCRGFLPPPLAKTGLNDRVPPDVKKQFDRAVIMVIDAWRADFAYDSARSNFTFVHSLINQGYALPFTSFAPSPTVTLPRLKGLTGGSPPNFLDAVLNIADDAAAAADSTHKTTDSWVAQACRANKTLRLLGDDTWLRLFPEGTFDAKSDGTKSFFVTDFVEVDHNVTRHLADATSDPSWDILILHYLGLDHIGHKGGASSAYMPYKHREMDEAISKIYHALDDDTLFVVLGDHGMTESGNHGGSTEAETSPALLFVAKRFESVLRNRDIIRAPTTVSDRSSYHYYTTVQQVDLVPTLSFLLGLPVPLNSIGVLIRDFLPLWSVEDQRKIVKDNMVHLGLSLDLPASDNSSKFIDLAYQHLLKTQEGLSKSATNYVLSYMVAGLTLVSLSLIMCAWIEVRLPQNSKWVVLSVGIAQMGCMFASSLVEEEHYFWYWIAVGGVCWFVVNKKQLSAKKGLLVLICLRLIRGWNHAGQKYADGPAIRQWLIDMQEQDSNAANEYVALLWGIVLINYAIQMASSFAADGDIILFVLRSAAMIASLAFKATTAIHTGDRLPKLLHLINPVEDTDPVDLARSAFMAMILTVLYDAVICQQSPKNTALDMFQLFLITQTRTTNIPVFTLFELIKRPIAELCKKDQALLGPLVSVVMQEVAFFGLGNSNSLASIDLANAYNGVSSYNIPIVGFLTFTSNWAGPLWWSVELSRKVSLSKAVPLLIRLGEIWGIFFACFLLRHHLFIWTVFSPKLLYACAWFVHFIVNSLIF